MQRKAQTGAIRRYCEELQRRDAHDYGFLEVPKILPGTNAHPTALYTLRILKNSVAPVNNLF